MRPHFFFILLAVPLAGEAASGVDTGAMNTAVDPCIDFYQYACGNWIAKNPLPADRSRFGRFTELGERTQKVLLNLLEAAAASKPDRSTLDQKIGDFFAACLDTARIEKSGFAPAKAELDRIRAVNNRDDLMREVARLHGMGVPALFVFTSRPDAKDSNRTIASLSQGGLSLPDREYYLKTDGKSVETRQRFEQHVENLLRLAGDTAQNAASEAKQVLEIEARLAQASQDRVANRDPEKTYHILNKRELTSLAPDFGWELYFREVNAPSFETLNVSQPDFVKQTSTVIASRPIDVWKAYLSYHWLRHVAALLPEPFEKEDFDFWGRYIGGAKEQRPRANRCVDAVDANLGDLLGQKYIDTAFGPQAKAQITELVAALDRGVEKDIEILPWMTPDTRKQAIAKLHAITNNVGYPKKWRDYSKVRVARGDYFGDSMRAAESNEAQRLEKIGKATDKSEWNNMTPPTVNAFYSSATNSINFPASILQWPFFDPERDRAVNYGGIGSVIGHEMTHGFDDSGRKYDGDGNLRDWWTATDAGEFEKRAACVANEYSNFSPVDGLNLNGRLTLGENTADNGGVRVALMALEDTLGGNREKVDGFTPEQRFFLGFAQDFCENTAAAQSRVRVFTDPHSPGRFRVNGTVQNMPEFREAFSCLQGQPMVSANACRVW
jgi:predicted metalloendopeptidase